MIKINVVGRAEHLDPYRAGALEPRDASTVADEARTGGGTPAARLRHVGGTGWWIGAYRPAAIRRHTQASGVAAAAALRRRYLRRRVAAA